MAGKGIVAALMVALLTAASVQASAAAGLTCGDAVNALIPCGPYLLGTGSANPSPQCCQSVQTLNKAAGTAASRRALCECFKQTGPSSGVSPAKARNLAPFCKINLSMSVSPNVDCNKIG